LYFRIIRVDLTTDKGETWFEAEFIAQGTSKEPRHFGWTLWKAEIEVPQNQKEFEIWSKAVDSQYNVQPEDFKHIWNLRGVLSNAYCKRKYQIQK
jgi:sulfite oxidase